VPFVVVLPVVVVMLDEEGFAKTGFIRYQRK
jgi:hypothetical protein